MIASARALPIPGRASSSDFDAELISSKVAAGFAAVIGVADDFGAVPGVRLQALLEQLRGRQFEQKRCLHLQRSSGRPS